MVISSLLALVAIVAGGIYLKQTRSSVRGLLQYANRTNANIQALNERWTKDFPSFASQLDARIRAATDRIAALEEGNRGLALKVMDLTMTASEPRGEIRDHAQAVGSGDMRYTVYMAGSAIYLRKKYSPTLDLVQRYVGRGTANQFSNGVIDFSGSRLIPVNTAAEQTATAFHLSKMLLRTGGDESPSFRFASMQLGGGHGFQGVYSVSARDHGLTTADVGSVLTDETGISFVVLRVGDEDSFAVAAANQGDDLHWTAGVKPAGPDLTDHSGRRIGMQHAWQNQFFPAVRNYRKAIVLDQGHVVSDHGIYFSNTVKIVESYDIPNPQSLIRNIANLRAASTLASVDITWSFNEFGLDTRHVGIYARQDFQRGWWGGLQVQRPHLRDDEQLELFLPESKAHRRIDLSEPLDRPILVGRDDWLDPGVPPGRGAMIVKTASGEPKWAYVFGYSPERFAEPQKRADTVDVAMMVSAHRKLYLHAADQAAGALVKAGTYEDVIIYDGIVDLTDYPDCPLLAHFIGPYGERLIIDAEEEHAALHYTLPAASAMKRVEVERARNAELLTPVVTASGIILKIGEGGGSFSAVLQ